MKTHKQGLSLLLVLALLLAWAFIGEADPMNTRREGQGTGWMLVASDDDIDASPELVTGLDTTFVQLAGSTKIYVSSSNILDITQTVSISGITSAGNRALAQLALVTSDYSSQSADTFSYIDQMWVDKECAGTVTVWAVDGVPTLANSIEIGALKADVGQHFAGDKYSYVQSWWATSTTTNTKTLELRWYPDDADCLDPTDGFMLLDRIFMADSVYTSDTHTFADYADGGIRLDTGGWLAVYGTGGAADQEATVTVIGFDRSR